MIPDRTPVVLGIAQHTIRDRHAPEPMDLLEAVSRAAAGDAGVSPDRVLRRLEAIHVVQMLSWTYDDAPRRLADRLGIEVHDTSISSMGGNAGQHLVNRVSQRMLAGELDLALICGAEALATRARLAREGVTAPGWSHPGTPDHSGIDFHAQELAHDAVAPVHVYPMLETTRRARLGRTIEEHSAALARLCSGMTARAAENPYAWFPVYRSPEEIVSVAPENRMVSTPYPKYMNAVMDVDMAAAVIVGTEAVADDLGVPRDRRVYLRGWADGVDIWYTAQRPDLSRSPAIEVCSAHALAMAGVGPDDVAAFDLYSCFPVAVTTALEAVGVAEDDPRGPTVTGGLAYAGGPANNYSLHGIAAMTERLRTESDAFGVCSGLGWFVTKHSYGVYAAQPPNRVIEPRDPKGLQQEINERAAPMPIALEPTVRPGLPDTRWSTAGTAAPSAGWLSPSSTTGHGAGRPWRTIPRPWRSSRGAKASASAARSRGAATAATSWSPMDEDPTPRSDQISSTPRARRPDSMSSKAVAMASSG